MGLCGCGHRWAVVTRQLLLHLSAERQNQIFILHTTIDKSPICIQGYRKSQTQSSFLGRRLRCGLIPFFHTLGDHNISCPNTHHLCLPEARRLSKITPSLIRIYSRATRLIFPVGEVAMRMPKRPQHNLIPRPARLSPQIRSKAR